MKQSKKVNYILLIFIILGFESCAFFNEEDRCHVYARAKKLSYEKIEQPEPYYIEDVEEEGDEEDESEDEEGLNDNAN